MHTNLSSPPSRLPKGNHMDLIQLLHTAVERGASDVHLKVGQPPIVRFDGDLQPLAGWPTLDPTLLEDVLREVGSSAPMRLATFESTGGSTRRFSGRGCPVSASTRSASAATFRSRSA